VTTRPEDEADEADALEELLDFVKESRAFDFTGYKRPSLTRRILKRVEAVRASGYAEYLDYLKANPDEFVEMFNTILINVTAFFRDQDPWETVKTDIIPAIVDAKREDENVRVWVAGCASGEEAYTVAMLLCDAMGKDEFRARAKIYATDVDTDALALGRRARYSEQAVVGTVPEEFIERYFERDDQGFQFRTDLRRAVIFGRHDLVQDPPISRIDLVTCRNTLMYFNNETQIRILRSLHFALRPLGYLLLGRSETLAARTTFFEPSDLKRRIFRRRDGQFVQRSRADHPLQSEHEAPVMDRPEDMKSHGFDASPVAQVIVDNQGILAAANQQARSLLGLAIADIGQPLRDLEVSYKPLELRSRIDTVYADRHSVVARAIEFVRAGETRILDINVNPLVAPTGVLEGVAISFTDVTPQQRLQADLDRAKAELETAYEELQSTVEELETTNEELQSTNEELETMNEELQSTNEELETMNEELQSTNEELETMNDELRERTDELNEVNAFLEAILTSLQSAVIVVDRDMRITVWNDFARDLWGLHTEEAHGEHFMNLDIGLPVEQFRQPIRACLSGDDAGREFMVPAVNRRGRKIDCHVRVSPLRAREGSVTGVIMVMDAEDGGSGPEVDGANGSASSGVVA
jgi:two-component system CheB/CheR fusion protein